MSDTPIRYVVGFLFHGQNVLLVEKRRPAWQAGRLNGIGGHVEAGETFLDAMRREFAEETGVDIPHWSHFVTLRGDDRDPTRRGAAGTEFEIAFFRAMTSVEHTLRATDEPLYWHDVHALPLNVLPNLRWLIPLAWYAHRDDWPLYVRERTDPSANSCEYGLMGAHPHTERERPTHD